MIPKDLQTLAGQKACTAPKLKPVKGVKKTTCIEFELPPGGAAK